ncbi:hypothetical protein F2Q70_00028414 [Brassica cretica]|uniref:K-box domain-containing protein n=1 Tax=Brassica cretica TaxID=69181 RepID=A0A8S9L526_BRACR|nr:hypothetical protein F2Q70_00028414 [Brassica cretica]
MYRTTRGSEQRRLQCLQDIQKLQEEIKLLQISNEKLNGVGLDDMSFTELASLGSMLDEGFRIVDEQLDNVVGAHEEITTKQLFEYDLMGGPDWTQRIEKEDLAYQSLLAGRRVASVFFIVGKCSLQENAWKVVSMKKIKRDEEMGKTKRPRPSVNKEPISPGQI